MFSVFAVGLAFSVNAQFLSSSPTSLTTPLKHEGNLRIGSATDATSRSRYVLNFGDGEYVKMGEWEADDQLSFQASQYKFNGGNITFPGTLSTLSSSMGFNVAGKTLMRLANLSSTEQQIIFRGTVNVPQRIWFRDYDAGEAIKGRIELNNDLGLVDYTGALHFRPNDRVWIVPLTLFDDGTVGIGMDGIFNTPNTNDYPTKGYKLAVKGKMIAEEVVVKLFANWPDYVFAKNFTLRSLSEVENYIKENNHLPDVPSEKEVQENGINLGNMDAVLLHKVEELTLYMIELNKKVEVLERENLDLKSKILLSK